MKQMLIRLLTLGTLIAGSLSARADSENPFGCETNNHPMEYKDCQKETDPCRSDLRGPGYTCTSAPGPHPDLRKYALLVVERIGVCSISVK